MRGITSQQYQNHWKRLTWRAMRMGLSPDEGEELAQEALYAAAQTVPHLNGGELRAWSTVALRNRVLNLLRTSAHQAMKHSLSLSVPDDDHLHPVLHPSQDDAVFLRQALIQIEGLPERARRLVILVSIEGRPYEEVCRMLEVPLGTLKSALSRAHAILRDRLMDRPVPRRP